MPDPRPAPGETPAARPRPRFGPVVVAGLAAAGAAAVAGNQAWVSLDDEGSGDAAFARATQAAGDASAPPVTALALVLLAAWGVLLVTRGRFRVGVAWLALAAGIGVLGFAVAAWLVAPDAVLEDLSALDLSTHRTAWSYLGVLAGVASAATALLAVRGVRRWPEMGRRYDAPGAGAAPAEAPAEDQSNIELWKALDEGRDPTAPARPADPPEGSGP